MIFSRDTSAEARRVLIELLRRSTPAEKLALLNQAHATARVLAMTGLRMRNPGATVDQLERRYLELMLGRDLAAKVAAARLARARSATSSG